MLLVQTLVATVLAASGQSSGQVTVDQKITLHTEIHTVPQVLLQLSEASGIQFVEADSVRSDVLLVQVRDVPLRDLMDRIAWTLNATWQQEGQQWKLTRTAAQAKAEWDEEYARRERDYAAGLSKLEEQVKNSPAFTEQEARAVAQRALAATDSAREHQGTPALRSIGMDTPAGRLLRRLMLSVPVRDLARMEETLTFTRDSPIVQRALKQFEEEQRVWARIAPTLLPDNFAQLMLSGIDLMDLPEQIRSITLSVSGEPGDMLHFMLEIAKGPHEEVRRVITELRRNPPPLPEIPAEESKTPIPLSPAAEAFATRFIERSPEKYQAYLLEAERRDPLNLGVSDVFTALSKTRQLNVVASPQDSTLNWLPNAVVQEKALEPLIPRLHRSGEIREEEGWFLYRPRALAVSRLNRISRAAIGELSREIQRKGYVPIRAYALYLAQTPDPGEVNISHLPLEIQTERQAMPTNWRAGLRFIGSLSQLQWQGLLEGRTLPVASLNAEQRKAAERWLNGPEPNIVIFDGVDAPALPTEAFHRPQRHFKERLPRDGSFHLTLKEEPAAFANPIYNGYQSSIMDFTARALALLLHGLETGRTGGAPFQLSDFLFGEIATFELKFFFGYLHGPGGHYRELRADVRQKRVPFGQLPQNFRDEVERLLDELRGG
jgi:hypothetical protein